MKPLVISLSRARSIILHAAGLAKPAQFGRGKEAVFKFIDHLGFLQIDTNFVVERAHHHAIATRVPNYETGWLYELQDAGRIFEYWTFASGFIPMQDGDVFILSPFDGLNVLRHRLRNYFGFDYQVECFVPKKKRKYGYFALPVLFGDSFIARMDAKAERRVRTLIVNNLHFEHTRLNHQVLKKLAKAIRDYVRFNDCEKVSFIRTHGKALIQQLEVELADILSTAKSKRKPLKR